MKALLIGPSIRLAVPHLTEFGPLINAPIVGGTVAGHWVEHLAALGARHVRIIAADRSERVQAELGDGARWGVRLEIHAAKREPSLEEAAQGFHGDDPAERLPAPHDTVLMSHLPGLPHLPLFDSYAGWFEAALAWLPRALTPTRVRMAEIRPGVWVSRRARVAPTAQLIAPCWIGDQVFVEPGAIVGPEAIVEDRAVIESEARVAHSWIGPDTFVGPMTAVLGSLAWGSTLINWKTDSSLRVPDPFLLCSLADPAFGRSSERPGRAPAQPIPGDAGHLSWIRAWPPRAHAGGSFKLPNPAGER